MSVTQYIGSRYVPLFPDPIEWDNTREYEPLTIVIHEGNSYTSRQSVPKGVDITNDSYWALTGNYNAQVEQYRRETQRVADSLPISDFSSENTVKGYIDTVNTTLDGKIGTNTENITNLQTDLSNEITARKLDIEKAHVFDTVADMKASQNLSVGAICHTNGFHTSGDGGAAWYEISDTGTVNDMDVLDVNDNLKASIVVTESYVTPEQLGSYGDGNHDDTAILQKCLDTYKHVRLNHKYAINNEINVPSDTSVTGNAVYGKTESNNSIVLMKSEAAKFKFGNKVAVSGLTFLYDTRSLSDDTHPICLDASNSDWCKFDNINILMADIGIFVTNSKGINFNYIYGYCTDTLIKTEYVYEITYFNYITCTPHAMDNYTTNIEDIIRYSYYNSTCLYLGTRTDWCEGNNIFGFSLLHVLNTNVTGGMFSNIGADACKQGFRIGRSSTSRPQITLNNISGTVALSGALSGITYDNDPIVLIDNETTEQYPEIIVNINNMQVWGHAYRIIECNRNYAHVNVNNLTIKESRGTSIFTNKEENAPIDYIIYSYDNNYINLSNVNVLCAGLKTIFDGNLLVTTQASNITVLTEKQKTNPLITNSNKPIRLNCENITFNIDSEFIQPESPFDPFARSMVDGSNIRAFGLRFNGISIAKVIVDTTLASGSIYVLLNNTIYKKNINEA